MRIEITLTTTTNHKPPTEAVFFISTRGFSMPIGDQAAELARSDIVASAVKSIPPVSVASATLLGYPLADWVLLLTAVYTILQICAIVRDKFWPHGRKHRKE